MQNALSPEKQEKIIADLLLLKNEPDNRKESILADPIIVLLGNPFGVLKEALDEFSDRTK